MSILKKSLLASAFVLTSSLFAQVVVLIDFGDATAAATTSDGNTWNVMDQPKFIGGSGDPLNDIDGNDSTWGFGTVSGTFSDGNNAGLTNPLTSLLGDFANADATADYFFTAGGDGTFRISSLDPTKTYTLDFFGTRDTTDAGGGTRETVYTLLAGTATTTSVILQTSGTGAGSGTPAGQPSLGNNNTLATLSNITPNASGQIDFSYGIESGGFGYIGAMRITEVPEPSTYALFAGVLTLGWIMIRRRRS